MGVTVKVLEANHGDCILISHKNKALSSFNILIDGGPATNFKYGPRQRFKGPLCKLLDDIKSQGEKIDLLILTHVDDDHINGLIKAFETPGYLSELVKSVWFNSSRLITKYFNVPDIDENNIRLADNSPQTSVQQGKDLEKLLDEMGCDRAPLIKAGQIHNVGPFKLTVLSPIETHLEGLLHKWPSESDSSSTSPHHNDYQLSLKEIWESDGFKEDKSVYNGSSIAFLLELDNIKMLFLGDAHDNVVLDNIIKLGFSKTNKLQLDLVKVSHHGSHHNTSNELLSLLQSSRYIISTDGSRHGLPNKRTIARIIKETDGKILFNYSDIVNKLLLKHEVNDYSSRLEALKMEIQI